MAGAGKYDVGILEARGCCNSLGASILINSTIMINIRLSHPLHHFILVKIITYWHRRTPYFFLFVITGAFRCGYLR